MNRKISDGILNALTIICSAIAILVLGSIIFYVASKGLSTLSWELLTSNYQSENYNSLAVETTGNFVAPSDLSDTAYFSEQWGIGVVDYTSRENIDYILVEYIDPASPFNDLVDASGNSLAIEVGSALMRVNYTDSEGNLKFAGTQTLQTASEFIATMEEVVNIDSMFYSTLGGGVKGALIATIYLILISLIIALPIGIGAAIYLNEYAGKNKLTRMLTSSIETLSGVPSIIFGLMGVAVFYPITAYLGATGLSILLGGMTMSVILLPTIIRATQEALVVIPQTMKDGSLALGANQSQTIFKIVLPCAMPGILTGVLLSVGRIIGESAALIYTIGAFVNDSPSILEPGASLAVQIYSVMSGEQPNFELASAISIIILVVVLLLNVSVKFVSKKISKAWY